MSKWLLSNKDVINMIVSSVIGPEAQDQYVSKPVEWPNFTRSDVIYCPSDRTMDRKLPLVLIEVEYSAGMPFYQRLIEHSLTARNQSSLLPIVIAFCIHSTTHELMELASDFEALPFVKQLPCHGWAQSCFLITSDSISAHIQNKPLHPIVALAHFLIEQKLSLSTIARRDDETIQKLYRITKQVFGDEAATEEAEISALDLILSKVCDQFEMAKNILIEDVPDEVSRKRMLECLDAGIQAIEETRARFKIPRTAEASAQLTPTTGTAADESEAIDDDWQFVQKYREEHATEMNWEKCFKAGKEQDRFKTYNKWNTLKSAYFRKKRKQD